MSSKKYPIHIVAKRTGLNVELLRAWERRYAVVEPERSQGGRRLYSAGDIERLSLLKRTVDQGLRIGDACRMGDSRLRKFLTECRLAPDVEVRDAAASEPTSTETADTDAKAAGLAAEATYLAACRRAVEEFDSGDLARLLTRATLDLSARALVDGVVTPLLVWVGERWSEGSLCVAQEHMVSAIVRSTLLADLTAAVAEAEAPCVVVTTPALELHEIGALLAARAAASVGWRAEYLGPNLPASEIALAARRFGANAVALSLARPVKDSAVVTELTELRKLLPKKVAMLVGGQGASAYAEAIEAIRARRFEDCWSFAEHLESEGGAA